jgi:hypothetical protein
LLIWEGNVFDPRRLTVHFCGDIGKADKSANFKHHGQALASNVNHSSSTTSFTMPTTLTPIKIPGKIKKDNSKAAIAARKALVRRKPAHGNHVSNKRIEETKGPSSQTSTSSSERS